MGGLREENMIVRSNQVLIFLDSLNFLSQPESFLLKTISVVLSSSLICTDKKYFVSFSGQSFFTLQFLQPALRMMCRCFLICSFTCSYLWLWLSSSRWKISKLLFNFLLFYYTCASLKDNPSRILILPIYSFF